MKKTIIRKRPPEELTAAIESVNIATDALKSIPYPNQEVTQAANELGRASFALSQIEKHLGLRYKDKGN